MSVLHNQIRDVGFSGDFDAAREAVKAALLAVDALGTPQSPIQFGNVLSLADVSGSDAAPVVNLRWKHRPAVHGSAVALEAVAHAAIVAGVANSTVLQDGAAEALVADFDALATALGL